MSAQPDQVVHQPVRLKVLAALRALPDGESLDFVRLRGIVDATEGNLGAHITTLESAGYFDIRKDFHQRRPRTRIRLMVRGRRALEDYVAYLRGILDT